MNQIEKNKSKTDQAWEQLYTRLEQDKVVEASLLCRVSRVVSGVRSCPRKIAVATDTQREKREVSLLGNALFDVSGNKERPFLIETEQARIEVLGTSFAAAHFISPIRYGICVPEIGLSSNPSCSKRVYNCSHAWSVFDLFFSFDS